MAKTWIALALILIIAGQLVVLSSFHTVSNEVFSQTNAVITIAKLSYVDASVTITIAPMPPTDSTNGTSNVEIVFPNGTTLNLTSSNWASPKAYTETFSFPRTGDNFGNDGGDMSTGNNSVSLSQDEPFIISIKLDVDDPAGYSLTQYNQIMEVSTFIVYGAAGISVNGYGVAL